MIKTKTVFILGAGASFPYGFPLGKGLCQEICQYYSADIFNYLNNRPRSKGSPLIPQEVSQARAFAKTLLDSNIKSIDKFLALNPEFMEAGKRAIIFRIFKAEDFSRSVTQKDKEDQDWYKWLYNKLIDEFKTKGDYCRFQENEISLVTFNYDRSLEGFLYNSFTNSFKGIDPKRLLEQINQIRIIHVFGRIAPLKWQDSKNGIKYARNVYEVNVASLGKNLRIIYEEGENPYVVEAQKLISEAKRIFFLGFGYAKENLDLFSFNPEQEIYGTTFRLTDREAKDVISAITLRTNFTPQRQPGSVRFKIENLDCLALLRKHL